MEQNNKVAIFEEKQVRRVWHNEEWYFSIIDIIEVLTDSPSPKTYWAKLKAKEYKASGQTFPFTERLKMTAQDGRSRVTDCLNTEGAFRVIMSIPSQKAEPFKLWLAQVGKERIEEIENPEIGFERLRNIYRAKGYTEEWIAVRLESVDIRKKLTDEWKGRGVKEGLEYSILTAEISKATFGMTPSEYQKYKNLERQNVRDHMSDLELIFTMLGEGLTKKLAIDENAQGFSENSRVAKKGGAAAGKALITAEKETGVKVVTKDNFLKQIEDATKPKKIDKPKTKPKKDE
jgi:DNA-damage-inducible protein D